MMTKVETDMKHALKTYQDVIIGHCFRSIDFILKYFSIAGYE